MAKTIAEKIIKTRDTLKSKRSTYKTVCDDVCRLFNPELEDLLEAPEGSEVLQPIISTGILAQERMTSGLFSNTMSMGRGNIIDQDPKKMKQPEVTRFYTALSKSTHRRIQQSPFPESYNEMLTGFGARGEGCFYVDFNEKTLQHEFLVYPSTKVFPVRDARGNLIEVYREYELSAAEAVAEFGLDEVTDEIRKAYEKEDHDKNFEFVHVLRRRRERNTKRRDSKNMPFESIHVEVSKKAKVKESGTHRMRYLMPRFYVRDGELSGRSPAMKALPVARTLMKVVSDHMDGVELQIGPPIFLPDKDAVESAVLEAFGVNYCDTSKGQIFTYNGSGNLQLSADFIEFLKDELNKLHYVDLFTMLEQIKNSAKTAFEISQLVAERIQAISPVINRLSSGFFAPLYEIVAEDILAFNLLNEQIPAVLLQDSGDGQGSGFNVQYTSRLDVQLSDLELSSLAQAVMQAGEMVAAIKQNPYLDAALKCDVLIRKIFEAKNVDTEMMYTDQEYKDNVKAFLEAQAKQAQQEALASAVKPIDAQRKSEPGSPIEAVGEAQKQNQTVAI
jgi:hypothetical protein